MYESAPVFFCLSDAFSFGGADSFKSLNPSSAPLHSIGPSHAILVPPSPGVALTWPPYR